MAERFAHWVLRWRWAVLAACLVAALAAASGGRFITFSDNYRVFFGKDNPDLLAFDEVQNTYTKTDNVVLAVAPRDGRVFTRQTLANVEWLTQQAWKLPYSTRVDSLTNFQHTSAHADDLQVRNLVEDAARLDDAQLERVRSIALAEPLLAGRLISTAGHVTGVNVTVVLPEKSQTETPEVAAAARKLAAELEARDPNLDVHLTGTVFVNTAFNEAAQGDLATLVPIMYLVIILVTFLSLRSIAATFAIVTVVACSVLTAMGLAGWLGFQLTPISAAAPTIILTVAVADSIHVLLSCLHELRRGAEKHAAIVYALKANAKAVWVTSLDTALGFLTLNFSEVPPYRDMGNMVALGVVAALGYSLLLLPVLVALLPVKRGARGPSEESALMARFADAVIRRRRPVAWAVTAAALALIACVPLNEFNDDFVHYFDERIEFRRDNDFVAGNLTGPYNVEYSLGAGESGGISRPDYLKTLDAFASWYRNEPGVVHVNVLSDVVKRLNQNMHGDDAAYYRIPDERDLTAQYLLLYELSLPFGLNLNDQINVDKSSTRMTVVLRDLSTKEINALEERARAWLREHAPRHMAARGTGPIMMFANISARNNAAMIEGDVLGVGVISLVMIVVLRSFKFALITLIPNLVPLGMAFGVWGLLVGRVGMDSAVVTGMTFGILVDDTVHNIIKYLYARRELKLSPEGALRYVFSTVGVATWIASLILICGFLVLSLSNLTLNSSLGLLTAITIAIALVAEFLLMPPLLLWVERLRFPALAIVPRPNTNEEVS